MFKSKKLIQWFWNTEHNWLGIRFIFSQIRVRIFEKTKLFLSFSTTRWIFTHQIILTKIKLSNILIKSQNTRLARYKIVLKIISLNIKIYLRLL